MNNPTTPPAPPKLHCALCSHCKVFRHTRDGGHTFIKLVRCAKGQWRDEQGSHRTHDHHHVIKLTVAHCEFYDGDADTRSNETQDTGNPPGNPTGDPPGNIQAKRNPAARAILRDIQASLPNRRVVYTNTHTQTNATTNVQTPNTKPC